ncbi:MAG: phosphatidylserine/phosphatidylglycerophosphate/cardiolipin synthase family protein [Desulfobacterales bacterium]
MKRRHKIISLIFVIIIFLLASTISFVFNPLGLGPEPDIILSHGFFDEPAKDLSELELLVDGESAFGEVIFAIDAARDSIYIQTYIWKDDEIGRLMVKKLKAAADRGVVVTIRKDVLGTVFELGDMLNGKPSPVFTSEGLKGYKNINVDNDVFADTDHSKYFIVDRQVVIFGGMNIADEYHKKWHDYMAAIRSARWTEAFEQKVIHGVAWPTPSPFIVAVNDRSATEIRTALIQIIDHAAEHIIIEHAYFSDDKVIAAVKRAAMRGIQVDVILPRRPDTHIYANLMTINRLLAAGPQNPPRIFLYPHMSHAKVFLTDGVIAAVGSANLTPRSMLTSKELTVFVHGTKDDPFISALRSQLTADLNKCERVLAPFELSFSEKIMAVAGKYIW